MPFVVFMVRPAGTKKGNDKSFVIFLAGTNITISGMLYSEKESAVNVAERLGYSKRTITRIHNAAVAHLAEMYEYAEKYDG